MNYIRNLLRRLWPFVTRRKHDEMFEKFMSKVDTQAIRINQITTWVRKLESKYDVLETKLQGLDTDMCMANADIQIYKTTAINNYAELAIEVERVKVANSFTVAKKPSRKKPAKKGKRK